MTAAASSPTTSMVIAFCYGWIASVGARVLACTVPPFPRDGGTATVTPRGTRPPGPGENRAPFCASSPLSQGQLLSQWNWPQLSRHPRTRTIVPTDPAHCRRRRRKASGKWIFTWKIVPRLCCQRIPGFAITPTTLSLLFIYLFSSGRTNIVITSNYEIIFVRKFTL